MSENSKPTRYTKQGKKLVATEAALRAGAVMESLIADLKADEPMNIDRYRFVIGAVLFGAGVVTALTVKPNVIGMFIGIAGLLLWSTVMNAITELHGFHAHVAEHREHTQAMLSRGVYAPGDDIKLGAVIENLNETCELCEKLGRRRGFSKKFRDIVRQAHLTLGDYHHELVVLEAVKPAELFGS